MSTASTRSADSDVPRYALAWATLTYVLLTLTLAYPALTGGFLVTPISDQFIGGFPVRDFAAQSLKAGLGIPLWNPYLFGGMPYVAAMGVGDIYYPTALMRMLLPVDVAMTWGLILHVVLAGVTMYVFCRAIGLGFRASLIGGAAYMMCGPVAGLVSPGHDGKLFISALTPLALFLLLRGVRFGDLRAWGALAITVGLAVLSPHPQLLQYMLLLLGFFGLYLAFGTIDEVRLDRRVAVQRLGMAAAMIGIGFLIGAIQYDPFIQYIPWSPRAGGTTGDFSASYSMPPEEIVNMYLPQFSGILDSYWGRNNIHFHSEYLGAGVLLLATAAIGAKGSALAMSRSFKMFVLGALVVSGLWALGAFTPFWQLVLLLVPGTKYFRAPSTIMYISAFCVCLFAAIGAERILAGWFSKPFAISWGIGAAIVALLGVTGGLTNLATTIANSFAPGTSIADAVANNAGAVAVGGIRSLFFVLIALVVVWGIDRGTLSARAGGIALLLGISADLWSVERKYWNFSPRAAELYRTDATIDYLKARRENSRVLTLPVGGDPMLYGDGLMVHGIRQAGGYHSNEIGRYVKLGGREQGWQQLYLNPAVRSLLNIRYLMTNRPPSDTGLANALGGLQLVAGPVRNAVGNMVYLYQMQGDNPPAWVATGTLKAPDEAALATLQDPRFNATLQRSVAIVDTGSSTAGNVDPAKMPPPSTITADVHRPNNTSIVVDLSAPAQNGNMLIVSENFYPGWNVKVDGKPAVAERADFTLIGVPLPAGARKIELEFTSSASARGKLLTIIATIIGLAIFAAGVVRHRTRSPIPEAA